MIKDVNEDLKEKLQIHASQENSQQMFDKVSKACFINLLEDTNNTKILDQIIQQKQMKLLQRQIPGIEPELYELFNLLFMFTIEVMKKNMVDSEVQASLLEQGWPQPKTDQYIKKLQQFREFIEDPENAIVGSRFQSKIPFNSLVDIDWKQEIIVSSKYANKLFQEIYSLQLHLKDSKTVDSMVSFKCTLPQLIEINNKIGVLVKNIGSGSDTQNIY